ncbi:MAG: diguanylate cyclase [Deltaproteobacteria bacterium]|nr:diguanylate cyclase [Deltaproteobacteria bacterium]
MSNPDSRSTHALAALQSALHDVRQSLARGELASALAEPELRALAQALADESHALGAELHGALLREGSATPTPAARPGAISVLAVDDDPVALAALAEVLAPEFEVTTTTDPYQALHLARERAPEAILCDLRMPGLDGLALVRTLHGDPTTRSIPVLLVSAESDIPEKLLAFEAGAIDYLTKPVSVDELAARLRSAVQRGRELRHGRELQETDELTGLTNRRGFRTFLSEAIRSAVEGGRPLAVAMLDQDGLKAINDTLGHAAGDAALRLLASTLRKVKRDADCACRLGGDEFALVMPGADLAGASRALERLERELAATPLALENEARILLRASVGIAQLDAFDDLRGDSLLGRADAALYEMKRRHHGEAPRPRTGELQRVGS